MAVGTYGIIRPSDISIDEIDVFYSFSSSRDNNSNEFFRLTSTDVLEQINLPTNDELAGVNEDNLLEGMYNLILPANIFNQIGIYTIYLRPRRTRITITDCGVLSALPSVKGLVLDSNQLPAELTANNALQGYRIEYINADGTKLRNVSRFVVTSNRVVPVTENIGNTSQTAVRYRFDDSGSLLFLQVTPSSASNVKPNVTPFIGNPNQTILLTNTSMNPLTVEVEMVQNDIDTVVDFVGGEQIKDVNTGILTNYDRNRNIISQFNLFEIKDDVSNVPLFEVKERRTTIDESQDFNDIISSVEQ